MKLARLFLAFCLLASLGCNPNIDIGNIGPFSAFLTVSVRTVGANLDADGYMLSITSHSDTAIGINESMAFSVMPIDITVELRDIASNCTVANNPRTIDVNGSTTTDFVVECS